MSYFICSNFAISDIADIANIFIAIISLFFAGYIFIYQKRKDSSDKKQAIELQNQSIRLQWFKELIIIPNLNNIFSFYEHLESLEQRFYNKKISEELRFELSEFVKQEARKLRKEFYDVLNIVESGMHLKIENNIDTLIDNIVSKIFDSNLNLGQKNIYDKHVGDIVSISKHELISTIYSHTG
jgi:hypothetical protein